MHRYSSRFVVTAIAITALIGISAAVWLLSSRTQPSQGTPLATSTPVSAAHQGNAAPTPGASSDASTQMIRTPYQPGSNFSTWHEYTSKELGLTLKLPPNWYPHEIDEQSGHSLYISAPVDNAVAQAPREDQVLAISIWREDNKAGENVEQWGLDVLLDPHGYGPARRTYVDIAGTAALQLIFIDEPFSLTAVNVGSYRYVVSASSIAVPYGTYENTINQMIASMQTSP